MGSWLRNGWSIAAALVLCGAGSAVASAGGLQPVDGLRDCPGGGFSLPGSSTCVRLGGSVRSDIAAGPHLTGHALTRLGTAARATLDVRTPTELGPLRVFTSVRSGSVVRDQR